MSLLVIHRWIDLMCTLTHSHVFFLGEFSTHDKCFGCPKFDCLSVFLLNLIMVFYYIMSLVVWSDVFC